MATNDDKLSRLSISSNNDGRINCSCCLQELQTFAYFSCMHFVCLKCAIKLRVVCKAKTCPVCRTLSENLYLTHKPIENKNLDDAIKRSKASSSFILGYKPVPDSFIQKENRNKTKNDEPDDSNLSIYFDEERIKNEIDEILISKCKECNQIFHAFDDLEHHIRKVHKKFYCEICLENLRLFPNERKYYNREDLAYHKRNGDKRDLSNSFKGHPLCQHCDIRFYDKDELYRHFRQDHYYCNFCDFDSNEEYYFDYSELRQHFLKSHFLCELDNCSKNAAETHEYVVFRTELDLKAHKKQVHAKTKSESKSYGKLNIEFNVSNSRRDMKQSNNRHGNRNNNNRNEADNRSEFNPDPNHFSNESFFPDLSEAAASTNNQTNQNIRANSSAVSSKPIESVKKNVSPVSIQLINEPSVASNHVEQSFQSNKPSGSNKMKKNLKEQYAKYEQTASNFKATFDESVSPNEKKIDKSIIINELSESKSSTASAQNVAAANENTSTEAQPIWRNLVSSGNAPKINTELEFPSLRADSEPNTTRYPTLSELGFGPKTNAVWGSKPQTKQSNQNKLKNQSKAITKEQEKSKSELIEEFPPLTLSEFQNDGSIISSVPTPNIFANSNLSLVFNKKKHRLQKY